MEKRFDPQSYERRWQAFWRDHHLFRARSGADADGAGAGRPFCIMIPPPNVTGKLHIGHALQSALQDLVVRWKRMQGFNALWLPGTDHAGISTQLMVERQLEAEGTSRREVGRERFEERTWEWKHKFHSNIRQQLEVLGASCDWSRERFTLDDGLSTAVRTAFVRLYREGLVTRGEYMVNWSPALQTAISDLEVETREVKGKLYHLAYPVADSDQRLVVATTRPETLLGDAAVAAHPDDPRYRSLIGGFAVLPILGRLLPIVADSHVDPQFGTGLVKVTPCHDPADYEIARRHGLVGEKVIGPDGRMTAAAGPDYAGLDRYEARRRVLERLTADGLVVRVEDHVHNVGHSQRSGEPIEPLLSTQWFCDMTAMAERALEVVRTGELELRPSSWDKTWEHWLADIRPWCISRQLWWGHRIPAWYDRAGGCHVALDREEAERMAGTDELEQDPDVLDTWFSSGLWPFSTLGWPDPEAPDLGTFYPTDLLITGFDILFFWVARMTMMGLHFTGETPFRAVHLTGLVRDADGEKMSKMKGNTLDPMDLVEEYGADALRFTLCALDAPGRDIPLDLERMAGYRAFGNKIWNATRFALSRIGEAEVQAELDLAGLEAPERWILSRFSRTAEEVGARFESTRFDEACNRLYHFFWGELCDWYIEFAKPALSGAAPRPRVGEVLLTVLDRSLRLLHPVMPHLTEELWQRLPGISRLGFSALAVARYPEALAEWRDDAAEQTIETVIGVVGRVRSLRAERGLSPKLDGRLFLEAGEPAILESLVGQRALVESLTGSSALQCGRAGDHAIRDRVAGIDLALEIDLPGLDHGEMERLRRELERLEVEIQSAEGRLANPQFIDKAPPQVIAGNRERLGELQERRRLLVDQIRSGA